MSRLFNPTEVVRETILPLLNYISRTLELTIFSDVYAVWDTSSRDLQAYALERSPLSMQIRLLCSVANGEFEFGDRHAYVAQRAKINDTLKCVIDVVCPRTLYTAYKVPDEFYLTQLGQVYTRCETALRIRDTPERVLKEA